MSVINKKKRKIDLHITNFFFSSRNYDIKITIIIKYSFFQCSFSSSDIRVVES